MNILGFTNVIFLCATRDGSDVLDTWFRRVRNLYPAPTQVIFCENDSIDNTVQKIRKCKLPHQLIEFKPISTPKDRYGVIAQVRQRLLEKAREIDPDYAIFLDDDIWVKQKRFIKIMTKYDEDIVGGPYLRMFPEGLWIASKWINPDYPKKSIYPWLWRKKFKGPLSEVAMTSGGCLALSRRIIQDERINFYPMDEIIGDVGDCSEDFGYCLLARKYGYRIYLTAEIGLQHRWRPSEVNRPWLVKGTRISKLLEKKEN